VQVLQQMSVGVFPEASMDAPDEPIMSGGVEYPRTRVRRADALVLFIGKRWAIEIKVSKADLRQDIADPSKQAAWAAHVHSLYFLVTPELLDLAKEIVPKAYGIMVPTGYGVEIRRRAKKNADPLPLQEATVRRMAKTHYLQREELVRVKQQLREARAIASFNTAK
jgi:hypothetical protein